MKKDPWDVNSDEFLEIGDDIFVDGSMPFESRVPYDQIGLPIKSVLENLHTKYVQKHRRVSVSQNKKYNHFEMWNDL